MENRLLEPSLIELRDKVLLMGGAAESALARAMRALVERDPRLAQEVIDGDDIVDRMELEVDHLSVDIFALKSPHAKDLRFVLMSSKLATILERMCDIAANIAKRSLLLMNEPQLKPYVDLPRMAEIIQEMLAKALESYASADSQKARAVIEEDSKIDSLYARIFGDLIAYLSENPKSAARVTQLLFITKHLERLADQITNICELVVYIKEARVIKHVHAVSGAGDGGRQ
ncbi:MAG TPA: phosphate signaling complex protein PhoU [Blastocatellia bacterium]|nr:phosphate signaling complex protein PhoU [Blastocatellia bacterium]